MTDIDAVVTWVDGSDPVHQAKLVAHLPAGAARPATAAPTRYASVGEIEHCVASLLTHAPFLRRIHVVTDAQRPPLFERAPRWPESLRERVRLIDHRDIFAGHLDLLPTFNSRSIETMLWRIPGLAEHFVYLNDDFALVRSVSVADWFDQGRPVLRGRWRRQVDREFWRRVRATLRRALNRPKLPTPLHQRTQSLSASMLRFEDMYYALDHVPHPLRRSTLEAYFAQHPQALRANASHRFRSVAQFSVCSLAHHLEIRAGNACLLADERLLYLEPATIELAALKRALDAARRDEHVLFACVQSLDLAAPEQRQATQAWLDEVTGTTVLFA
jgi:hypothetical protein